MINLTIVDVTIASIDPSRKIEMEIKHFQAVCYRLKMSNCGYPTQQIISNIIIITDFQ